MICAKCKTLIRPRPSVCEVCQPPVPAVEGEPDRAEVLEEFADDLSGVMQPDSSIEVCDFGYRYYLKLDRVEKI